MKKIQDGDFSSFIYIESVSGESEGGAVFTMFMIVCTSMVNF